MRPLLIRVNNGQLKDESWELFLYVRDRFTLMETTQKALERLYERN